MKQCFYWFAEEKEMDVDTSDTANAGASIKFDLQSSGSNVSSTPLEASVNEDRQEPFESSTAKTSITAEGNGPKSLSNDESVSTVTNRPPKSELQLRNDSSSAINKPVNQPSDVPVATESDPLEIEIKQEDTCLSPNAPLPPHALSKIQVCTFKVTNYIHRNRNVFSQDEI